MFSAANEPPNVDDSGHFLSEKMGLEEPHVSADVTQALAEGLAALSRQEEVRTLNKSRSKLVKVHRDVLPPSDQTSAVPGCLLDSLVRGTIGTANFPGRCLQSP